VIARGSAQERVPLLELARRKGFLDDVGHGMLRDRIEVIAKMISGLINGLVNRQVRFSGRRERTCHSIAHRAPGERGYLFSAISSSVTTASRKACALSSSN
jgi:hypothetical protein